MRCSWVTLTPSSIKQFLLQGHMQYNSSVQRYSEVHCYILKRTTQSPKKAMKGLVDVPALGLLLATTCACGQEVLHPALWMHLVYSWTSKDSRLVDRSKTPTPAGSLAVRERSWISHRQRYPTYSQARGLAQRPAVLPGRSPCRSARGRQRPERWGSRSRLTRPRLDFFWPQGVHYITRS